MSNSNLTNSKAPTHILVSRKVQVPNQPPGTLMQQARLYRCPEGLQVAQANDALLSFGEDPQHQQMRTMLSHQHAVARMRDMADRDWAMTNGEDPQAKDFFERCKEYAANIQTDDGQQKILTPDQAISVKHPFLKQ